MRGRPPETFDPIDTAIVLAVLGGARSFRDAAEAAHVAPSAAYNRARRLRACGLVAWRDGAQRTLRPGVRALDRSERWGSA
jgi:DNA-binding IclR family transcriptional regulator